MKLPFIALVFSCLAVADAQAQTACDRLAEAIETSAKEISFYAVDGALDNSAPRATNRKLEQNMHVGLIQANLTLMQANKCPLPKAPFSESGYKDSAFTCVAAAMRGGDPTKQLPECDRAKWVRTK